MLCSFLKVTSGRTGTRTYFENLPFFIFESSIESSIMKLATLLYSKKIVSLSLSKSVISFDNSFKGSCCQMKSNLRQKKTPLCYTCCSPQTQGRAQRCKNSIHQKADIWQWITVAEWISYRWLISTWNLGWEFRWIKLVNSQSKF